MNADLITLRPEGLYCPAGDFFIDPWRKVARAVITHAHADHARSGHGAYLAHRHSEAVLRLRLGKGLSIQTLPYGERIRMGQATVSLHPAGHVLGSAQVRVEVAGQVWVASGDYFLTAFQEANPTCAAFEPVACHCFITESTFGLPIYRWAPLVQQMRPVNAWWSERASAGGTALLQGYSFGKAQRLLAGLEPSIGPIFEHAAAAPISQAYREAGVALPPTQVLRPDTCASALRGAMVIAPPGASLPEGLVQQAASAGGVQSAFASGWIQVRKQRVARSASGRGFVISDHADWPGLLRAIAATQAQRVIVTHGFEQSLVRYLKQERGLDAGVFKTQFGDAQEQAAEVAASQAGEQAAVPAPEQGNCLVHQQDVQQALGFAP